MHNMVKEKSWDEFQNTGLFMLINSILHVFGWALVWEYEWEGSVQRIKRVFPARTKYRGFTERVQNDAHQHIAKYLSENIKELKEETEL